MGGYDEGTGEEKRHSEVKINSTLVTKSYYAINVNHLSLYVKHLYIFQDEFLISDRPNHGPIATNHILPLS